MRKRVLVPLILLPLAGCLSILEPAAAPAASDGPTLYKPLESSDVSVNAAEAASMINGFRAQSGLGRLAISPKLTAIAVRQAKAMAAADNMSHDVGGHFTERLAAGGYKALAAGENIGAGYRTLAEAFSGWRDSPGHRRNMLIADATEMGIATAYAPGSRYKVYWALVLARPE